MTTKRTSAKPRTKALAAQREAARLAVIETDLNAARETGHAEGYAKGVAAGIQLCKNLIGRREHDHLDRAKDRWLFKGTDTLLADECTTILLELGEL